MSDIECEEMRWSKVWKHKLIEAICNKGSPNKKNTEGIWALPVLLLPPPPPPPHSNGHSGALHLGKKCPKPSGQGSRPPKIKQILPKKVAPRLGPSHPGKG